MRLTQRISSSRLLVAGAAIGILTLGALLRFYRIGRQDLWYDETYSVFLINHFDQLRYDYHPPLYYALLQLWSWLVGDGEAQLRALSAVGSLCAVAVTGALAGSIGGRSLGLLSAALVACSPVQIWYAQEVRSYAWLTAFIGLVLLSIARRADHPNSLCWRAAFIGACLAAIYTSYATVFFLAAIPLLLVAGSYRAQWFQILSDLTVVGLGCLPLLSLASSQTWQFAGGFWIPPVDPQRVLQSLQDLMIGYETKGTWAVPVLLGVFIVGLARWWRTNRAAAVLLALGSLGPMIACAVFSRWHPLYLTRQLLPAALVFWIVIASVMMWARTRRVSHLSLIAMTILCLATGLRHQFLDVLPRAKPPFKPVFAFIQERWAPGDTLIHANAVTVFPAFYYGETLEPYIRLWWSPTEQDQRMIASQWTPSAHQWADRRISGMAELGQSAGGRFWVLYGSEDRAGTLDAHANAVQSWFRKQQDPELAVRVEDIFIERYAALQSANDASGETGK